MDFNVVGSRTESIAVTLKDFELERILQEAYTLDQIIEGYKAWKEYNAECAFGNGNLSE